MSKLVTYAKECRTELQKVIWPTKQAVTTHTLLVIGMSVGLAAFLGAVDYLFTFAFEQFLRLR